MAKSREWTVRMQKDIIKQVNKSGLHGSHPRMKERMMDFQEISKKSGFKGSVSLGR